MRLSGLSPPPGKIPLKPVRPSYISIARSVLPEAVDPKIKTIDFLILFFFIRLLR